MVSVEPAMVAMTPGTRLMRRDLGVVERLRHGGLETVHRLGDVLCK